MKDTTFLGSVLGGYTFTFYFVAYFFAVVGILFMKFLTWKTRRDRTLDFNVIYWFKDNWKDMTTNFLLVYIAIRFTSPLVVLFSSVVNLDFLNQVMDKEFTYFLVGFFHQTILQQLRKTDLGDKLFKLKDQTTNTQDVSTGQDK